MITEQLIYNLLSLWIINKKSKTGEENRKKNSHTQTSIGIGVYLGHESVLWEADRGMTSLYMYIYIYI